MTIQQQTDTRPAYFLWCHPGMLSGFGYCNTVTGIDMHDSSELWKWQCLELSGQ